MFGLFHDLRGVWRRKQKLRVPNVPAPMLSLYPPMVLRSSFVCILYFTRRELVSFSLPLRLAVVKFERRVRGYF